MDLAIPLEGHPWDSLCSEPKDLGRDMHPGIVPGLPLSWTPGLSDTPRDCHRTSSDLDFSDTWGGTPRGLPLSWTPGFSNTLGGTPRDCPGTLSVLVLPLSWTPGLSDTLPWEGHTGIVLGPPLPWTPGPSGTLGGTPWDCPGTPFVLDTWT